MRKLKLVLVFYKLFDIQESIQTDGCLQLMCIKVLPKERNLLQISGSMNKNLGNFELVFLFLELASLQQPKFFSGSVLMPSAETIWSKYFTVLLKKNAFFRINFKIHGPQAKENFS